MTAQQRQHVPVLRDELVERQADLGGPGQLQAGGFENVDELGDDTDQQDEERDPQEGETMIG